MSEYEEIVWLHGKAVARSKSLRAVLSYASKHSIKHVAIRRLTQGEGYLYVSFDNEANYTTTFADFVVLKHWLRVRRHFQGVTLYVDGASAGVIGRKNEALA